MTTTRVTTSVARWSANHPWRALLVWLLFIAGAVAAGSMITTQQVADSDTRVGQSGKADHIITRAGLDSRPSENVMITAARRGSVDKAAALQAAHQVGKQMATIPVVHDVGRPVWSPDETTLLLPIELDKPAPDQDVDVGPLQDVTAAAQDAHPNLTITEVGEYSINDAVDTRVSADLGKAEKLSLPITLLIMLVAFGALIAAGIPVLLAITGVFATIGLYAPLSYLVPADSTVSSMVLLIGMAVGVDYTMFYLKREREEREKGHGTRAAVEIAAETSGHSIVVSGVSVIVAMSGLFMIGDPTFASLATGAILVVGVSVLASLTVLPALLSVLGRFVDRPRVPLLWRLNRRIGRGGISRRVLGPVVRHPKSSLLVSGAIVAGLAIPAFGMQLHEGNLATLPHDIPEVQAYQHLEKEFPQQGVTMDVAVSTTPQQMPAVLDGLRSLNRSVGHDDDFVVSGPDAIRVAKDRTAAVLTVATSHPEGSAANRTALDEMRQTLAPHALDSIHGADWAVGGDVASTVDFEQHETAKLPYVIGFVLALTMIVIGLTFRSVVLALVTTVLNLASVAASFGVVALVFQHHWAEGLLGFQSSGFVVDWIPLFMFVMLVGLSMDYHVFVLSRIRENVTRGLPPRLAVEKGVADTAGVVTSAAIVMVSVFAIFATLSLLELKQIGVGLAVAVLLDATLIRVVMLPSILVLLGRAAWWPSKPGRPTMTPVVEPYDQLAVDAPRELVTR